MKRRVIVDNVFSGDPDDLFQLAHMLLSPSVRVCGIIGSHLARGDFLDSSETSAAKCLPPMPGDGRAAQALRAALRGAGKILV